MTPVSNPAGADATLASQVTSMTKGEVVEEPPDVASVLGIAVVPIVAVTLEASGTERMR